MPCEEHGPHRGRHRPTREGVHPPAARTSRARPSSGVGFDRDRLKDAGIEQAGALAAVTNGDNSNILVARVARETFGIERVVARIYDPRRAAIYERVGIPTIATVQWATERVLHRILPDRPTSDWVDPSAKVMLVERPIPAVWAGTPVLDLEADGALAHRRPHPARRRPDPHRRPGRPGRRRDPRRGARRRVDGFERHLDAGPDHGGSH